MVLQCIHRYTTAMLGNKCTYLLLSDTLMFSSPVPCAKQVSETYENGGSQTKPNLALAGSNGRDVNS
ncbi:hypothetical protein OPV22_011919 [Ensete ventricosum]|uniref:Uncharacterized protein n=1 Tax=Ensete ventricosum TaxID=4639 RepID=A0AAV8RJ01_ENSVE|nr:hypothetical protein OPV22_011919 [Ensete ventricosum]